MSDIQVLGARGMLGQAVCAAIVAAGHQVVDLPIDVTRITSGDVQAPFVINCAGLVKQRLEYTPADFMLVNGYAPHHIADVCRREGSRLVHVSTDCVFRGPGPHSETDVPDADDIYALSKRAGEVTRGPHLTLRTSFVGWGARGLLHDLATSAVIHASRTLLWSGHTTPTVAAVLVDLALSSHITGLLHLPGMFQTRWSLVWALCARYGLSPAVIEDPNFTVDRRLISQRWHRLELPTVPSFAEQLLTMERPV